MLATRWIRQVLCIARIAYGVGTQCLLTDPVSAARQVVIYFLQLLDERFGPFPQEDIDQHTAPLWRQEAVA